MPGSYTFLLPATREVPRRLQHPKRSTIGVRVPDHPVVHALLAELGEPILSSTLILPGDDAPLNDADAIRERDRRPASISSSTPGRARRSRRRSSTSRVEPAVDRASGRRRPGAAGARRRDCA